MRSWKKRSISAALALTCVAAPMAYPMTAYAASTAEKILYGAAAMVFISSYYSKMDDESQLQLLDQCQQETGVYDSAEADNRVQTVYQNLKDTGHVLRDYKVYVSPSEDINAFASLGGVLCVNKGTLDQMDDDELAYVMAHEIAHGEKRHSVSGLKKRVGLVTALNIYLGDAS